MDENPVIVRGGQDDFAAHQHMDVPQFIRMKAFDILLFIFSMKNINGFQRGKFVGSQPFLKHKIPQFFRKSITQRLNSPGFLLAMK